MLALKLALVMNLASLKREVCLFKLLKGFFSELVIQNASLFKPLCLSWVNKQVLYFKVTKENKFLKYNPGK